MAAESPLDVWQKLPGALLDEVDDSFAPDAVKSLFRLWGTESGIKTIGPISYVVQPDDPSVSAEFIDAFGRSNTLSLAADGLSLAIFTKEETADWRIPASEIWEGWRYDAWSELIVLQ